MKHHLWQFVSYKKASIESNSSSFHSFIAIPSGKDIAPSHPFSMKIVWVIGLTILATNLVQSVPTNQGLKHLTEDDGDMFMEKQGEEPLEEDDLSVAEQGEQQEEKDDKNVDTELNSDLAEKKDGKQNIK